MGVNMNKEISSTSSINQTTTAEHTDTNDAAMKGSLNGREVRKVSNSTQNFFKMSEAALKAALIGIMVRDLVLVTLELRRNYCLDNPYANSCYDISHISPDSKAVCWANFTGMCENVLAYAPDWIYHPYQ